MRARWIVFPQYAANAATSLRPIDRPAALWRLLEESYMPAGSLNLARVESLVGWMREVDCYALPFSSLKRAVDLVRRLSHRPPPARPGVDIAAALSDNRGRRQSGE
jgi:hypothetical protein